MKFLDIFRRPVAAPVRVPTPSARPVVTKGRLVGAAGAGLLASVTAFVYGWEDVKLDSYRDVVGVWTACAGETAGIGPDMRFTRAQCDDLFSGRIREFETGMRKCLTAPDAIPDKPYVAFLSLSYNIGTAGFCRSSIARKANGGDLRGACEAILLYDKAGGRRIKGLTRRRQAERALCLEGLPS